jgi:Mg2+-importing ATPase
MNKDIYKYSILELKDLEKELEVSVKNGLDTSQVNDRLNQEGQNSLSSHKISWVEILSRQFKSPFVFLLLLAAVVSFFLEGYIDALIIVLFISLNTFLGFFQEFKSENALQMLEKYTQSMCKVLREGKQILVTSEQLVRGDFVVLETGDKVPADLRLIDLDDVVFDETNLTGESVAIHKSGQTLELLPTNIYEARNLAFSGTMVVSGACQGLVVGTGENTAFGQIKKLTTDTAKESIFTKGIAKFSGFILKMVSVTLVFVFLANLAIKGESADIGELLIFAITLAVGVIPEALPIVTTLAFSNGALRLAKKNVIVRRLSAVEDLGSIQILCTDKTGTITRNKLEAKDVYTLKDGEDVLLYGHLAGSFIKESLEPFDEAFRVALDGRVGQTKNFKLIEYRAFDPKKRSNSVLVQDKNGEQVLIVRGAPEEVLSICSGLDSGQIKGFREWYEAQGALGNRVIALARHQNIAIQEKVINDWNKYEKEMELVGAVAFVDPIKPSTKKTIAKAKSLGVDVKILTGDDVGVAFNVGKQIGLVENQEQVILATKFLAMSRHKQKSLIEKIAIFARTDPNQKHYLVQLMQETHEVGFLGEGINDAPSLKAAGVSIVVQSASDVSREVADIVLLKNNLGVIVDSIEEGRKIFANTIKYLKSTLASNFGNFYAVAVSSLFISYLPMLPVQILLVNLLSDFPAISLATDNVDKEELLRPKKYDVKDLILLATILGLVSTVFDFMTFGFFYRISPGVLQTNWFMMSILTELAFFMIVRTKLPIYRASMPSKTVLGLSFVAAIAAVGTPFTTFGQEVFGFVRPSGQHLLILGGLLVAYIVCSEIIKNLYYKITEE